MIQTYYSPFFPEPETVGTKGSTVPIVTSTDITNISDSVADITTRLESVEAEAANDTTPPSTVTGLSLSSSIVQENGEDIVTLTAIWNPVTDSDLNFYEIAIKEATGSFIEYTSGKSANRYDWKVRPNRSFTVKVRAVDSSGNRSAWSAEVTSTSARDTAPPTTPTLFSADAAFNTVFLKWTNPTASDLEAVEIYEGTTNVQGSSTFLTSVGATSGLKGSYTRSGLSSGQTRYYWIRALDSSGNYSPFSSAISVTTAKLDMPDFTPGVQPMGYGPTLPNPAGYTGSSVFYNTTDGKVYRLVAGAWTANVTTTDLQGDIVADQLNVLFGGGNLLKNSSFERFNAANTLADGFSLYANNNVVTGSSVPGRTGGLAQRVTYDADNGTGNAKGIIPSNSGGVNNLYTFKTATSYVWSFYAKGSGSAVGRTVTMNSNYPPSTIKPLTNLILGAEWKRFAFRVSWNAGVTPGTSIRAFLAGDVETTGSIDFDDVQVEEAEVASAYAPALAPGEITNSFLADMSVSASKIVDGAISNIKISDLAAAKVTGQLTNSQIVDLAAAKLTGQLVNAQIASGVDASKISGALTNANLATTKITGQLTNAQIADLAATKISGTLSDSQLAAISATKITGQLVDTQIAVVGASKVTGQLTNTQIASLAATKISGTLTDAQLAAISAIKITGQLTDAQLAGLSATKLTGTITNTQIADDSISTPKLQAGSIVTSKISAGAIDTTKIAAGAVTADEIAANAITAPKISAGAVDATKIVAGTITANELASGAITTPKIAAGAVTANELAANSVTAVKILADSIDTSKIAAGAVTANEIAANAITAPKISAGAVDATKIVAGAVTTNKLTVSERPIRLIGIEFTPNKATNRVSYTSGQIVYIDDAGVAQTANITGSTTGVWTPGNVFYCTYIPGETVLNWSGSLLANRVLIGMYTGGANWLGLNGLTTIDGTKIISGTITAGQIAAGTITANEIDAGAITTPKLATNAVTANEIAANAVTTAKISAGAIDASKIAAGAVTTSKLIVASRPFVLRGSIFRPNKTTNQLTWSAGTVTTVNDAGAVATYSVNAGSVSSAVGTATTVYWNAVTKSATLVTSTSSTVDLDSHIPIGIYSGGADWVPLHGGTVIDGSKIITGSIAADQIAAQAVTTEKLTLVAGNMIANGQFTSGDFTDWRSWTSPPYQSVVNISADSDIPTAGAPTKYAAKYKHPGGGVGVTTITTFAGTKAYSDVGAELCAVQTTPGKEYSISVNAVKSADYDGNFVFLICYRNNAGDMSQFTVTPTFVPTTSWGLFERSFVAPPEMSSFWLYVYAAGISTGWVAFTNVKIWPKADANLIVDGAIVSSKIATNAITADKISAGAIDATKIAANTITAAKIAADTITGNLLAPSTSLPATITVGASGVSIGTIQSQANDPAARINTQTTTISGGKITTGSVTAAQLAAGTITGDKIQAGTISTALLAAGAISSEKLAIGVKGQNLIKNPSAEELTEGWTVQLGPGTLEAVPSIYATEGRNAFRLNKPLTTDSVAVACLMFPVSDSKKYVARLSAWGGAAAASGVYARIEFSNTPPGPGGSLVPTYGNVGYLDLVYNAAVGTNPTQYERVITPPAGAQYATFTVLSVNNGPTALYFDNTEFFEQTTSAVIADGAITTPKMIANTINGDRIQTNTLDAAKIKATSVLAGTITVSGSNLPLSTAHSSSTWTGTSGRPADTEILNNRTEGGITRITMPAGGAAAANNATVSGALKITLPQSWTYTMMLFEVEIYEYSTGKSAVYTVGGYTYTAGAEWLNTTATMVGSSDAERPVLFGHDGTKCCIWIGLPSGTWSYPQVRVRNFAAGYSNFDMAQWATGWNVSFSTAALPAGVNHPNPLTGASWSKVSGAGKPADNATVGAPSGTNVGDQLAQNVAAWALNPAGRINAYTTQIDPGKILISGGTSLASWRNGGDNTKIEGGSIAANTISANKLTIGNRGIGVIGINFEWNPTDGWVYWSDGYLYFVDDNENPTQQYINAGNTGGATAYQHIYWQKGNSNLSMTQSNPQSDNTLHMASWWGGSNLVVNHGGTIINGDRITTGTIHANKISAGTITGDRIEGNTISADKLNVSTLSAISANIGLLRTASSGARTEIENNQIRVYDAAGTLRVRLGVW